MVNTVKAEKIDTDDRQTMLEGLYEDFCNQYGEYGVGDLEEVKNFYPERSDVFYAALDITNPEQLRAVLNMQGAAESEVGYLENEGYQDLYDAYIAGEDILTESDKKYYSTMMDKIVDTLGGCFCDCLACESTVPSYLAESVEVGDDDYELPEDGEYEAGDYCNNCAETITRNWMIEEDDEDDDED